jgi:hypothetical protein
MSESDLGVVEDLEAATDLNNLPREIHLKILVLGDLGSYHVLTCNSLSYTV